MNNDALAFNANELIAFLQKPKEEITKADIVRFVMEKQTLKKTSP